MKKVLERIEKKYWGDLTGISGDVDLCEITPEEREKGIKIEELIKNKAKGGTK